MHNYNNKMTAANKFIKSTKIKFVKSTKTLYNKKNIC